MSDAQTPRADKHHRTFVRSPVRNHWFTGKLLDAYHMKLETDYGTHQRWLVNRMVLGSGVVAGLDVKPGHVPRSVVITPGLAIDWHGREVIVPAETKSYEIPQDVIEEAKGYHHHEPTKGASAADKKAALESVVVQVQVVYRESDGGPVPVDTGGDCDSGPCVPGTTTEGYAVRFLPTPEKPVTCHCHVPDLVEDGGVDHAALARWVTRHVPLEPPRSAWVTLANIRVMTSDPPQPCQHDQIDITVRPIVYSNDLLFQIDLGLADEGSEAQFRK